MVGVYSTSIFSHPTRLGEHERQPILAHYSEVYTLPIHLLTRPMPETLFRRQFQVGPGGHRAHGVGAVN